MEIKSITNCVFFIFVLLTLQYSAADNINTGLIGYWKFDGDCKDYSGKENHGRNHGADLSVAGRGGKPNTAAKFDGIDDFVEVADSESLHFGINGFTIAAWVNTEEDMTDVIGDVASKFDDEARTGFNLYIKGSSAHYNSQGDARNVHFGIDNSVDGPWEDCGRLWPSNTYVSPLTVFDGHLYGGLADALGDGQDACHVYRYAGGKKWFDLGRVCDSLRTRSVQAMIVHKGDLYVGPGWFAYGKISPETCDIVHVYRYDGGTKWVDCGAPGDNFRVFCLASYKGDLYASASIRTINGSPKKKNPSCNRIYRYVGGTEWVDCGGGYAYCMMVHNGNLYAGNPGGGMAYRYEGGDKWSYVGHPGDGTQLHCLEVYKGKLHSGSWPKGAVCRYEGGTEWTECGQLGVGPGLYQGGLRRCDEVQSLTVYNGKLYAGAIPKSEVYRYNGGTHWSLIRRFGPSPTIGPHDKWTRLPILTVFDGKLYAVPTTVQGLPEANPAHEMGRVYSMTAGANCSYERNLGSGWKHIVAVRENDTLQLYIDGKPVDSSPTFKPETYDISNDEPLKIGFGAVDYFTGAMDEMRIYDRTLSSSDVEALFNQD